MSWKEDAIMKLSGLPDVYTVVADQCMYGLASPTGQQHPTHFPAMKPTRFMTNSVHLQLQSSKRCDRSHTHQQLIGGRFADAAFYPLGRVKAILIGIQNTSHALRAQKEAVTDRLNLFAAVTNSAGSVPLMEDAEVGPGSCVKRIKGGVLPIGYHPENFRPKYIDEWRYSTQL